MSKNPNHNPDPHTQRGINRRKKNYPKGIPYGHPAWVEGGYLCQAKPSKITFVGVLHALLDAQVKP